MNTIDFKSEKITKTASFEVNGNINKVFPLFGAFEERKWAAGWSPKLVYPSKEIIEEGTTFTTAGHGENENEFLWRVSKYEPTQYMIQHLVSTNNRFWTITVECMMTESEKTYVTVTYSYIGLNSLGNEINQKSAEKMYSKNLNDWKDAINYYLSAGETLRE